MAEEFPLLKAYGLHAADIRGDGNCLFNALSDQIYGHQNDHDKIRARVIQYMREHADYYKQFIDVYPGGGQRRNPKRKNAGVYSTPANFTPPTPEEIDRVFESHLSSMARGGTYGDNMEISAFASAYGIDVKIYQQDFAYMIPAPDTGLAKPIAHIAYHSWEHYSSIRNIDGPHTGLPEIREVALSPEEDARNKAAAEKVPRIQPWQVNVVMSSLPYLADRETIKKTLEEYKGNVNDAVSALLDAEDRASVSSQQGSSSTERDQDSDDEQSSAPSKKQDRRLSRATKSLKEKAEKAAAKDAKGATTNNLTALPKKETAESNGPLSPGAKIPVRLLRPLAPKPVQKLKEENEEEWLSQSDDSAEHHSKLTEADEDAGSELSGPANSQSDEPKPQLPRPTIKITFTQGGQGKTAQKQPGPQKRIPARQLKEEKKQAQKAARKERAKTAHQRQLEPTSANTKNIGPPLDLGIGIKTLYI